MGLARPIHSAFQKAQRSGGGLRDGLSGQRLDAPLREDPDPQSQEQNTPSQCEPLGAECPDRWRLAFQGSDPVQGSQFRSGMLCLNQMQSRRCRATALGSLVCKARHLHGSTGPKQTADRTFQTKVCPGGRSVCTLHRSAGGTRHYDEPTSPAGPQSGKRLSVSSISCGEGNCGGGSLGRLYVGPSRRPPSGGVPGDLNVAWPLGLRGRSQRCRRIPSRSPA